MKSRNTKQKEILEIEMNKITEFFSADNLLLRVKKQNISLATIYRFLNEQVKNKKLFQYVCDRKNIYSKQKSHCHFECEETGKITHFEIESLDFLKDKIPGEIRSFNLEVKGKCNKCQVKIKQVYK